jgi:hypothetical protein
LKNSGNSGDRREKKRKKKIRQDFSLLLLPRPKNQSKSCDVIRGNRKNVKPIAGIIAITATAICHCYHLLSSEQEGREPTNER